MTIDQRFGHQPTQVHLVLLCAVVSVCGCGGTAGTVPPERQQAAAGASNTDAAVDTSDFGEASGKGMALQTSAGDLIKANSLRCIYRQSYGAAQDLSLQLQYLSGPSEVAFAVYVTDPVPGTPFEASPETTGEFLFEVFHQGSGYSDGLESDEVTIQLESLPAPGTLSDGDVVALTGTLQVAALSLPSTSADGQEALELNSVAVDIDAVCNFQLAQVVN